MVIEVGLSREDHSSISRNWNWEGIGTTCVSPKDIQLYFHQMKVLQILMAENIWRAKMILSRCQFTLHTGELLFIKVRMHFQSWGTLTFYEEQKAHVINVMFFSSFWYTLYFCCVRFIVVRTYFFYFFSCFLNDSTFKIINALMRNRNLLKMNN